MLTPEQLCVFHLANMTWQRRGAALRAGLTCSEETMTENMLLDLKLTYPGNVQIVAFNKRQEAITGADWAWNFQSANGIWNQPMLVQAKRLDDDEIGYSSIDHQIGKVSPGMVRPFQIDRLITKANNYGFPAVYAFYNYLSNHSRVPNSCTTLSNAGQQIPQSWGIAFADAAKVKAELPDKAFDTHRRHSLPFHCLLCSLGSGQKGDKGTAGAVARMLDRLASSTDDLSSPNPTDLGTREPDQSPHPIFKVADQVASIQDENARENLKEKLAAEFPDLAGVAIFRDGDDT